MRKHIIHQSFSKQATTYDRQAQLQRESSKRLSTFLPEGIGKQSILEIGSGSGFLTEQLVNRDFRVYACDLAHGMNRFLQDKLSTGFPNAPVSILTGDAEHLPFVSEHFDTVASNLCFQWVDGLSKVFPEVMRVLVPGGSFVFSVFGEKTLCELRGSFRQAAVFLQRIDHTQEFPSRENIHQELDAAGFIQTSVEHQVLEKKYRNLKALLRNLKMIGSVNASEKRPQGLGYRKLLEEAEAFYRRSFSHRGWLRATYEIYYVRAYKKNRSN
jgi:malonyl-CoA O-methyltransferase